HRPAEAARGPRDQRHPPRKRELLERHATSPPRRAGTIDRSRCFQQGRSGRISPHRMEAAPTLDEREHQHVAFADGLMLECGVRLAPLVVAYRTYGRLDAEAANAVLVCHALTGDQYVAETHPVTGKPGWWDQVVGPGRPIDTDRTFVICANVLGGCMGSSGPRSVRDATGTPWGTDFPPVT